MPTRRPSKLVGDQPGVGMGQFMFKVVLPPDDSLVKLCTRVFTNRCRLPADAGIPLIQAVDADGVPIVTVTLASHTYDDYGLKRLADSVAEPLRSTPGVSVVSEIGRASCRERVCQYV